MRRRHLQLLAGFTLVCAGVGVGAHQALADDSLVFASFSVTGTSQGVVFSEDEPSANAHPEGQAAAPEASILLSNGPSAYALSTVFWPGATEANGGALLGLLFPKDVSPPQGLPSAHVPDALYHAVVDNKSAASYPVRAEASTGTKPDDTYDAPGTNLTSHVTDVLSQATGAMDGSRQPGPAPGQPDAMSFGNVSTASVGQMESNKVQASADSSVSNMNFGGVIKIKSVISHAETSTNGKSFAGTGFTVVSGMTVADQPAYVDEAGFHIGTAGQPANAVANQIANQALSGAGYTVAVSQPMHATDAASSTRSDTAGSLFIIWKPPGNPSENVFVYAIGGARTAATASLDTLVPPPTDDGGSGPPVVPVDNGPALPPPDVSGGGFSNTPGTTTPPAASANNGGGTRTTTTGTSGFGQPIRALVDGIGLGWILLVLLGSLLIGRAVRAATWEMVETPPSSCPLEGAT